MKVEFKTGFALGDGRELFIPASEFFKTDKDPKELDSFFFAYRSFCSFYGVSQEIHMDEFEILKREIKKNGALIITMAEDMDGFFPVFFSSADNNFSRIELNGGVV